MALGLIEFPFSQAALEETERARGGTPNAHVLIVFSLDFYFLPSCN
jgi:hypothetical protein